LNYEELRDKPEQERLAVAGELFKRKDYGKCERVLSMILDQNPVCPGAIATLGSVYIMEDRYGSAEIVYRYGVAFFPQLPVMWIGLGSAIRNPYRSEECFQYLEKALELAPDNTVALTNMAAMYAEIGENEKAIEYAEKSLALKEDCSQSYAAIDAIGMASLAMEDFERGFRLNRESLGIKFRKEIVYGDEERWEGEKDKIVVIYGEQGIGDEIFYGSVIPDAIRDCKHVIIDCDDRLEGLFKRSFPEATVYGTRRKAAPWLNSHTWDARCAMADLSYFYRKKKEDYPGTPFLKPDPVRSEQWKRLFDGKTKIGIAMRGGNKFTNREDRTIPIEEFRPLLDFGDLVSLEYSAFGYGDFPIEVYDWATQSVDYDNTVALVSQLDYIVTTCTAVVHVAGGLGIPCYVLRNKFHSWRYANDMPMYDSVTVIPCDGDWEAGIKQVVSLIEKRKAA